MKNILQSQAKLDDALDLLADRYRRRLLMALLEHNPQDADEAQIPEVLTIEDDEMDHLRIQIIHTHLPKLAEAGAIEWDRDTYTISKGPQFNELLPLLQLLSNHADALPKRVILTV